MTTTTPPTILVIIGITGDLARRKLLPAIAAIARAGMLPQEFRIVGISRRELSANDVFPDTAEYAFLRERFTPLSMNLADSDAYSALAKTLETIEQTFDKPAQRLFYLSIPPQAARPVLDSLGLARLNTPRTKLLLEKPFGTDLTSATELITSIKRYFTEEQTYRIDHYLAKEMAQNLVVFRNSNSLFKQTWNNAFIESISIVASEDIGVEGRGAFYEQTGALRDLVQSHLLQLAALTLMDLPDPDNWEVIPQKRLEALQSLIPPQDVNAEVIRGQYHGYRDEVGNPQSATETFVQLTLYSKHPAWQDVPITITTGKALDRKATEIRIRYKQLHESEANELILRVQPDEGVTIQLWVKKPGYQRDLQKLSLDFSYRNHFQTLPEAYERVFVDALRSDHSLFTTSDEVLAAWRILEPIQHAWDLRDGDLILYEPGATITSIAAK